MSWVYEEKEEKIQIKIQQLQQTPFSFPLDITFQLSSGKIVSTRFEVNKKEQVFTFQSKEKPIDLVLDPHTALLFESVIVKE